MNAIALELLKAGIKPGRGTKDIDFAVMISSMNEYDALIKSLESKGFHKVRAPWTFYSEQYNVAIDLLPFGEIEEKDTIRFSQRNIDLHVLGFKEVLADTVSVDVEEKIAAIPSLPGMVILKLVAWSDRPEERTDDLPDILKIIEHYFEIAYDEIVEFHNDLFPEEEDMDLILIAAEVLGRECAKYLNKSKRLSDRIHAILRSNLVDPAESAIAKIWARQRDWDVAYAFSILEAFQKGLIK